ncbi:hypothetical protein Dvar_34520 [Desulfosarcina variabilis str. Montpellier]|uniref:hypothetical protein n=1 Tax=Desulfosarcina variabilis TaxID=2300 RepID=UPI003AFA6AB6
MRRITVLSCLIIMFTVSFIHCQSLPQSDPPAVDSPGRQAGNFRKTGTIASDRLVECSGIDMSMIRDDLLWAINDSGDGPYLYAMGIDGSDRGQVRIAGAVNRDWEDLATFKWQDRAMILVADVGDNRQRYGLYRLYIVEEPVFSRTTVSSAADANVAWTVTFRYPDRNHDAEAVGVDPTNGQILVLTKRDTPPLLFSLPLKPENPAEPVVARPVAAMDRIPAPTSDDLFYPYGQFRSQPTAMDLSPDGLKMVILTYKHAYLFDRTTADSWQSIPTPTVIPLPLPQDTPFFAQREAACFSRAAAGLFITAEALHAVIYHSDIAIRQET